MTIPQQENIMETETEAKALTAAPLPAAAAPTRDFHPAAAIFELLEGQEFEDLCEDIRKHGLRLAIWLHPNGSILDGRNRYRACLVVNVVPQFQTWDGNGSAADFVWSLNFSRRHLDDGAKAMAAARYAIELEREAKERQGTRTDLTSVPIDTEVEFGRSREKAAEKFGVSEQTVARAVTVAKAGVPELVQKVEAGDVSVSAAADVARLPEPEQRELVARGEKEILAAAQRIRREREEQKRAKRLEENRAAASSIPATAERYQLFHASCIEALGLDPESVDWVITDPPYPAEFLPVLSDLGQVAAHVLKPGGAALVMSGQAYLPEVIRRLDEHLTYQWTLAYRLQGDSSRLFGVNVFNRWKPVLMFRKGKHAGEWFDDMVVSEWGSDAKEHHHWGQSVTGMRDLMKRFVRPGQVVLDPFLGGGTTAIVALELGAAVIGYDIDENAITATRARIGEVLTSREAA
jgi:DNA methylase